MTKRKSWKEKLEGKKDLPKIVEIPEKMRKKLGEGTMVIPSPKEVDEIMKRVPKGKVITINEIRKALAKKHRATVACPMTTGIFAWIAAHAAEEAAAEEEKNITPYWRTLKTGGKLNPKYPGGVEEQARRLKMEGHEIILGKNNKPVKVKDYLKKLAHIKELIKSN